MERTVITLDVQTDALVNLRRKMTDTEIARRCQVAVDDVMTELAWGAHKRHAPVQHDYGIVRAYKDGNGDLFVAWTDVCFAAEVRNAYLEGRRIKRSTVDVGGKTLQLARARDAIDFLEARRVRQDEAKRVATVIQQLLTDHKQP